MYTKMSITKPELVKYIQHEWENVIDYFNIANTCEHRDYLILP